MFTVLVCDDDAAILESLRIYLSQEGYRVLCARDGLLTLYNTHSSATAAITRL